MRRKKSREGERKERKKEGERKRGKKSASKTFNTCLTMAS